MDPTFETLHGTFDCHNILNTELDQVLLRRDVGGRPAEICVKMRRKFLKTILYNTFSARENLARQNFITEALREKGLWKAHVVFGEADSSAVV